MADDTMEEIELTIKLFKPVTYAECNQIKHCTECFFKYTDAVCPDFEDDEINK
jgi:hypothetical protein